MNKSRLSTRERVVVAAVALVFTGLCTAGMLAYLGRDNRWFAIVSPKNEKAVEIVAVTRLLQPYVRTDAGNYFWCTGNTWQDSCRQIAAGDVPTSKIPGRWQTCQPEFPALPPLSRQVVDSLDVGQCQEGRTYARLVVLDDGTIWKWQRTFSWVNGFALGSTIVWSLLIGAVGGLALVRVRRYLGTPIPEAPTGRV
jgi:hypothetical protein